MILVLSIFSLYEFIQFSFTLLYSVNDDLKDMAFQRLKRYHRFFSRCSAEDTSSEKTTRTSFVVFGRRHEKPLVPRVLKRVLDVICDEIVCFI